MPYSGVLFEGLIGSRFFKIRRCCKKVVTITVSGSRDGGKAMDISFLPQAVRKELLLRRILTQEEADIIIRKIALPAEWPFFF